MGRSLWSLVEKIPLESFNGILFLAPSNDFALVINDELKQIHPLYPFKLVFNQHLPQQDFGALGNRVDLMRNLEIHLFQFVHEFGDRA